MASRTEVILISDLSGDEVKDGGESIDFSYRGVDYTIDLTDKEAKGFDRAIAMYVEHAQPRADHPRPSIGNMRRHRPHQREQLQAAREWLRANGHAVSDRGRIKSELMDLYNAAQ
jgi:hypothetical protein